MLTLIANRYNSQKVIQMTSLYGCRMSLTARWQVSFKDGRGRYYDYYFITKPTRKQIRKLIKDIK